MLSQVDGDALDIDREGRYIVAGGADRDGPHVSIFDIRVPMTPARASWGIHDVGISTSIFAMQCALCLGSLLAKLFGRVRKRI